MPAALCPTVHFPHRHPPAVHIGPGRRVCGDVRLVAGTQGIRRGEFEFKENKGQFISQKLFSRQFSQKRRNFFHSKFCQKKYIESLMFFYK